MTVVRAAAVVAAVVALGPGRAALGAPTLDCLWDNGGAALGDAFDGQVSHVGGGAPWGEKAADDFYLSECEVHEIGTINVMLATDMVVGLEKAKIEIFDDCNGLPGKVLYTLLDSEAVYVADLPDGFRLMRFTFRPQNQSDPANQEIILRGGRYWLAAMGRSDRLGTALSYFAQSVTSVTGRPGVKTSGVVGSEPDHPVFTGPWAGFDDCCLGCSDLAFTIEGKSCSVLFETGPAATGGGAGGVVSEYSEGVRDSRGAGDFVINPCEHVRVCYIEGCVLTNCTDFAALAEIFPTACRVPGGDPGAGVAGEPLAVVKSTSIVALGTSVLYQGRRLYAYRVCFNLWLTGQPQVFLDGGGYWLAISVVDTYSSEERALLCFNESCESPCLVKFNPAASIDRMSVTPVWESLPGREVSFLIAGEPLFNRDDPGDQTPSTPACMVDIDHNGLVDVDDLFSFIDAFFAGCP